MLPRIAAFWIISWPFSHGFCHTASTLSNSLEACCLLTSQMAILSILCFIKFLYPVPQMAALGRASACCANKISHKLPLQIHGSSTKIESMLHGKYYCVETCMSLQKHMYTTKSNDL